MSYADFHFLLHYIIRIHHYRQKDGCHARSISVTSRRAKN